MPYCTPWHRCYQCQWRVSRMRALVWSIFRSCLRGKICDTYLGCSCSEADQETVSIFHITPSATGSLTEAPQCCGNRDNGLSSSLSARIDVSGKILWLTLIWHFAECAGKVERWRAGTNDGGEIKVGFSISDFTDSWWLFSFPLACQWFCYIYLYPKEATLLLPFVLWPNST